MQLTAYTSEPLAVMGHVRPPFISRQICGIFFTVRCTVSYILGGEFEWEAPPGERVPRMSRWISHRIPI